MHSASETSSDASARSPQPKAHWWHPVPETGRIVCDLCPRACSLKPGDRGFCFVRENRDGEMLLSTYGRSTGFCIDPIEKKPLNHFYPGTSVLSFGTAGCNLGCKFCQNWDISKSRDVERLSQEASPEAIATAARELGCRSVAFTYNDPVVWAEYAIDTARACREQGIKTVAVTAGYIMPEARGPFYEFMDAANVDLKAFTEDFYWHLTQSHLEPVLDTLRWLKRETDVWFEITNLVIPQANDSREEFERMCGWVLDNLGDEVPLHFTAFHPDFRLTDRPPTPPETLLAAYEIARRWGLKFVYVGNVHDRRHGSTYCPGCGQLLIDRDWHQVHAYRLNENRCAGCGTIISGRFDAQCGTWNGRREAVDMARFARVKPVLPIVELPAPAGPNSVPPAGSGAAALSPSASATLSPSASAALAISAEQQRQIHRAASQFVRMHALQLGEEPTVGDLAGAADLPVWGAFVTLKRRGRLRSCCGQMGGLSLIDAVRHASARAARDDLRLPVISPTELEFLDLEVTVLHNQQPIAARGEARVSAVVPGRHGLVLQRGQASGLFLPQVALEHHWNSERFLRELCVKAGLATTAWKQDDTRLWTFEGFSIPAPLDAGSPMAAPTPRFGARDAEDLNEHCRKNLLAFVSGAVACYYLPDGPDGNVNGILLTVRGAAGEELITASHFDLLKSVPLQATAYQLVEAIAAKMLQQGVTPARLADCLVSVTLLTDPAMHGTAAEPDLRGIDPARRTVLVLHQGSTSWAYDPTKSPTELHATAIAPLAVAEADQAGIFSFATTTTLTQARGVVAPRPAAGASERPPAVAGAFYPEDPQQLARLVEDLASVQPAEVRECSAVLVPHAGYRFSGRLAAATLAATRIPDTVIIIGPKHTNLGVDWAVAPHATWRLPGMAVHADLALARWLAKSIPGLTLDAAAHEREHAIEVELPLIARLAPHARVVGIVMGSGNWERCQAFASALAEVIRGMAKPPLLIISSDMNHFATDAENRELDALALAQLERLDAKGLYHTVREHHISMCGMLPAVVVLETLRQLGRLHDCRRIGYATSADATGDTSRVVGYAGLTFGAGTT